MCRGRRTTRMINDMGHVHWAGVTVVHCHCEEFMESSRSIPVGIVAYHGIHRILYISPAPPGLLENACSISFPSSYTCIGASDKILDHCFCLNSAATTPLTLDPMGSPALLMSTHALSSNFTTLPSGRCHFFAVRTTTAWRTSPRRTLFAALMDTLLPVSGPKFRCFFTTTTMRSPGLINHCNPDKLFRDSTYRLWRVAWIAGR